MGDHEYLWNAGEETMMRQACLLTLPPPPQCHIRRALTSRRSIDIRILQEILSDIFLFTGIRRPALYSYVKRVDTSKDWLLASSSQNSLKRPKFIVLQDYAHFEPICARTPFPVHLLHFHEGGSLSWRRSHGDMSEIQKHVLLGDLDRVEFDEHEFVEECNKDPFQRHVCICDKPGTGKTVLLSRIGRKLASDHSKLVLYFRYTDVLKSLKRSDAGRITKDEVASTLSQLASVEPTIRHKLCHLLASNYPFDLLLDGYDEISLEDNQLAESLLKCFQTRFPYIRLWTTTRPEGCAKLENLLGTLSFNIVPYQEKDQLSLVQRLWISDNSRSLDKVRLEAFARSSLKSLRKNLGVNNDNVAGSPLQCFLLATALETKAIKYSTEKESEGSVRGGSKRGFSSLFKLYDTFVRTKFAQFIKRNRSTHFSSVTEDQLRHVHMKQALKQVFPNANKTFKEFFPNLGKDYLNIPPEMLHSIGIVDSSSAFIHRTFVDYFVALFVIDVVLQTIPEKSKPNSSKVLLYLLEPEIKKPSSVFSLPSYAFRHGAASCMLNSALKSLPDKSTPLPSHFVPFNDKRLKDVFLVSVASNYFELTALLLNSWWSHLKSVFATSNNDDRLHELLTVVTVHGDVKLLELVCNSIESWGSSPLSDLELGKNKLALLPEDKVSPIMFAAQRGSFPVFEMLFNKLRLRSLFVSSKHSSEGSNIVSNCLLNSTDDERGTIEGKIEIVNFLLQISRTFFVVNLDFVWIQADSIHPRLMMTLFQQMGWPDFSPCLNGNLFQKFAGSTKVNRDDFHELIAFLDSEDVLSLVVRNSSDRDSTTLHSVLQQVRDLRRDTLKLLLHAGAPIRAVDINGNTVLDIARMYNSNFIVNNLVEFGGARLRKSSSKNRGPSEKVQCPIF